jgi:hypothetical protein
LVLLVQWQESCRCLCAFFVRRFQLMELNRPNWFHRIHHKLLLNRQPSVQSDSLSWEIKSVWFHYHGNTVVVAPNSFVGDNTAIHHTQVLLLFAIIYNFFLLRLLHHSVNISKSSLALTQSGNLPLSLPLVLWHFDKIRLTCNSSNV